MQENELLHFLTCSLVVYEPTLFCSIFGVFFWYNYLHKWLSFLKTNSHILGFTWVFHRSIFGLQMYAVVKTKSLTSFKDLKVNFNCAVINSTPTEWYPKWDNISYPNRNRINPKRVRTKRNHLEVWSHIKLCGVPPHLLRLDCLRPQRGVFHSAIHLQDTDYKICTNRFPASPAIQSSCEFCPSCEKIQQRSFWHQYTKHVCIERGV